MPYLITTTRPSVFAYLGARDITVRRAVATLDEAIDAARGILRPILTIPGTNTLRTSAPWRAAARLPEQGGTIGPLPDGTVITVELISDDRLARAAGLTDAFTHGRAAILDAYNAQVA